MENFQIIDHDLVHIAPLDDDHKMTGRLTGYGKTIDLRYRSTDEHLFSSTRSHEHHENSQHPYDMESSNFKDYDCLYKGKDLSSISPYHHAVPSKSIFVAIFCRQHSVPNIRDEH